MNNSSLMNTDTDMKKELIIKKLRDSGCRVTKQRLMILDIILKNECSCCKEIYYKVADKDESIGTATVYRMINTLEEIGAINRKNMYRVEYGQDRTCDFSDKYSVELSDGSVVRLSEKSWQRVISEGLRQCGYLHGKKLVNIKEEVKEV